MTNYMRNKIKAKAERDTKRKIDKYNKKEEE